MAIEVGTKLEGRVTGITHFGAFVELAEGVTGLVHISEIADNYVKDVNDHLKLEDKVMVKVINVDKDGKIGLSIKQTIDKPVEERPARPERTGGSSYQGRPSGDRPGGYQGGRPSSGGDVVVLQAVVQVVVAVVQVAAVASIAAAAVVVAAALTSSKAELDRFRSKIKYLVSLKIVKSGFRLLKKNTESKRGGRGGRRD